MLLIDAIHINNSGGKVLLDYLIINLERSNIEVHYLLDSRVKDLHPNIESNEITYLNAGLKARHIFYKDNRMAFSKVLCFGNLPPPMKLNSSVYTYLHQRLFIETPQDLVFKQKLIFWVKSNILGCLLKNTNYWIVQTNSMKRGLLNSKPRVKQEQVICIPFYPQITKTNDVLRKERTYCYVSAGTSHKNHPLLIEAFVSFSKKCKDAVLELTVGSEFEAICRLIEEANKHGANIINHGMLNREGLASIYGRSTYLIYPSLSESFGLGIVEAIESGCKVIGADLAYMHEVCIPSITFHPLKVNSILEAFNKSIAGKVPETNQIIHNQIDNLIALLKNKQ